MKSGKIIIFIILCLWGKNLLATEIVGSIGYQNYQHDNYSSFGAVSPSVEIYVPVYKNLSAGFGLSYANINYGSSDELANNVGYSGTTGGGDATHGIIPLQIALRYDYELQRDWKIIGVLRAGLSAGWATYYNSTACDGGACMDNGSPVNASERITDDLEIATNKIFGFDVGVSYKQYAVFFYYSAMNVANSYNQTITDFDTASPDNPQQIVTDKQFNHNRNNSTMQAVGFKIAYLFDY